MEGEVMVRRRVAIAFDKLIMGNGVKGILDVVCGGLIEEGYGDAD